MGERLKKFFDVIETGGYSLIGSSGEVARSRITRQNRVAEAFATGGYSLLSNHAEPVLLPEIPPEIPELPTHSEDM